MSASSFQPPMVYQFERLQLCGKLVLWIVPFSNFYIIFWEFTDCHFSFWKFSEPLRAFVLTAEIAKLEIYYVLKSIGSSDIRKVRVNSNANITTLNAKFKCYSNKLLHASQKYCHFSHFEQSGGKCVDMRVWQENEWPNKKIRKMENWCRFAWLMSRVRALQVKPLNNSIDDYVMANIYTRHYFHR